MVEIKVDARDPDGVPLTFAWRVDGRPAGGNAPALDVPVDGAHAVSLEISDANGDGTVWSAWRVEPAPEPTR